MEAAENRTEEIPYIVWFEHAVHVNAPHAVVAIARAIIALDQSLKSGMTSADFNPTAEEE